MPEDMPASNLGGEVRKQMENFRKGCNEEVKAHRGLSNHQIEEQKVVKKVVNNPKMKAKVKLNPKEKAKEDCKICFDNNETEELAPLNRCNHVYHTPCLLQYFETMIDERNFPLNCPACRVEATVSDVTRVLTPELVRKWEDYTFKKMVDTNPHDYSYCPTPDCPYVFIWDECKDSNHFECPRCMNSYCLNCKCKFHKGQTCKDYQKANGVSVFHINNV
eukprot:TRINITY_DN1047_c0_g2_i1.p1 TRINITY_DN1047_c0_g2~~TRINITY_DN1047_c0_g2_i1.p1  ORF type:complete len:219 (+),score=49.10 TRINITY_DN1047_c0_g2_i1:472-1128(+)